MLDNFPNDKKNGTSNEQEKLLHDTNCSLPSSNNNVNLRANNINRTVVGKKHKYNTLSDGDNTLILSDNYDCANNDKQYFSRQTIQMPKLNLTQKSVGLKRVSFGSSKGSMVETFRFETPTPLSELVEPSTFGFEDDCKKDSKLCGAKEIADDSGIDVHEESERSIVKVSIYQSIQPQQIYPPEYLTRIEDHFDSINYNIEDIMANSTVVGYDRQQSTDSGWDNPFRPGGDLSKEADEIVNMIRGGKPITPTEETSIGNGKSIIDNSTDISTKDPIDRNVTTTNVTYTKSAQNGSQHHNAQPTVHSDNSGISSQAQVSKQLVPGPTSASHVVIDEKKNKKKGCCVIQ